MLNREEELRFCKARRAAIALDYQNLNPEQRRAALATEGPLPAPASRRRGPSVARAARRCSGFRFWNSPSMTARLALQNLNSWS